MQVTCTSTRSSSIGRIAAADASAAEDGIPRPADAPIPRRCRGWPPAATAAAAAAAAAASCWPVWPTVAGPTATAAGGGGHPDLVKGRCHLRHARPGGGGCAAAIAGAGPVVRVGWAERRRRRSGIGSIGRLGRRRDAGARYPVPPCGPCGLGRRPATVAAPTSLLLAQRPPIPPRGRRRRRGREGGGGRHGGGGRVHLCCAKAMDFNQRKCLCYRYATTFMSGPARDVLSAGYGCAWTVQEE